MGLRHSTAAELELYVLDALDATRAEALEAHAQGCAGCASALAREACLELAFEQMAKHTTGAQVARVLRAGAYGAAGLLVAAAAAVVWIGHAPFFGPAVGEGRSATAGHAPMDDGAILDAKNDAFDGG